MKKQRLALFALLFSFISKLALTAPMITSGMLPITEEDRDKIYEFVGRDQRRLEIFLNTLTELRVYPDHSNPTSPEDLQDKKKLKVFWAAPLLSPSPERPTVGALAIAKDAIKIVDEFEDLMKAVDINLRRAVLIEEHIVEKKESMMALEKKLVTKDDELGRRSIRDELSKLDNDIKNLEKTSQAIRNENITGLRGHPTVWLRRIVNEAIREFARLGVTMSEREKKELFSDNYDDVNAGLAKLRARIAKGQFGIQQVVLEAGLNQRQMEAFGFYSTLHPDVQIRSLNTFGLYVYPALQTADDLDENQDGGLPLMVKAINGGAKKAHCGAQSSCNIVMEYTEIGARWAQGATAGVLVLPVTFEADVEYEKPPFKGEISCNFKNTFTQKGRLDVKDGAVIYDGDVYDSVKYNTFEEGGCDITTVGGAENDAKFYLLEKIFNEYVKIRSTRAQQSSLESRRERKRLTKDVEKVQADLRRRPPNNEREYLIHTLLGLNGANGVAIVVEVLSSLGKFFWHTKILDTEIAETVNIKDRFNHQKILTRERRAYDAFPIVCWKNTVQDGKYIPFPVACSNEMLKTQSINTIVGSTQEFCDVRQTPQGKCQELVDNLVKHNPFGERFMLGA